MRAGLSTILQTLTPDAAGVLNQSIGEAARRSHGQTTPLHVAATLLAPPAGSSGRPASAPTPTPPILCRVNSGSAGSASEQPPISNALMAALKRAQANQRRGCQSSSSSRCSPSRWSSSTASCARLASPAPPSRPPSSSPSPPPPPPPPSPPPPPPPPLPPPPPPRRPAIPPSPPAASSQVSVFGPLRQPRGSHSSPPTGISTSTPVCSSRRRAPLPPRRCCCRPRRGGEGGNQEGVRCIAQEKEEEPDPGGRFPAGGCREGAAAEDAEKGDRTWLLPQNVEIISVEKRLAAGGSHIPSMLQELSDSIDRRLNEAGSAAVGVVLDLGDLQWLVEKAGGGVSAAVVAGMKNLLARFSEGGAAAGRVWLVGSATSATYLRCQVYHPNMELDWDLQALPIAARSPFTSLPGREMCPLCKDSYEHELAKLVAMEFEKSSDSQKPLPPWLQLAKLSSGDTKEQELLWKKTTEELLKRWSETCHRLHPNNSHPPAKLQPAPASNPVGPRPGSPVGTDLVLGCTKKSPPTPAKIAADHREKVAGGAVVDYDSFKRLFKGLTEKVSWQQEAASAVATTVMHCKSAAARGKKMAAALSELVFSRDPVTVSFAGPRADGVSFRGRTAMDRVVDAIRRNPFSVVVLDGVDSADMLVLGSLRRAMESGRLPDSHGREVPMGSTIFVLISGESTTTAAAGEEKLLAAANSGWQLELAALEKPGKRRAEWSPEQSWPAKPPRISLDLNLAAGSDEDTTEGSLNSSDLTVEHDAVDCNGKLAVGPGGNNSDNNKMRLLAGGSSSSSAWEMLRSAVDATVPFKPVDFGEVRRKVSETMTRNFRAAAGECRSLVIDEEAMDRLVGGLWFGSTTAAAFEEWTETVMVPCFRQLRRYSAVRLLPVKEGYSRRDGGAATAGGLPTRVRVAADGLCGVP
ncbi:unnamed protein product [Spirodela intermedia]|uniref:Uncharacterized protein n=1 Tax=Spirodela intermedia TaxID=51605 RepID=A0A7I8JL12_SPIIN|nr:unnamed protein product [Spirodela intermedia]CAA6670283.1 unnamed protein product [Spirodela intermedia]